MAFDPSGLTETQKKQLKASLDKKLDDLNKEIRELEAGLTEEDASGKDAPDEVDRSSFEEEMQRMQLVLDGKNQLRYEVQAALKRFDEGSYGVCEETEEPIGFKRLSAQPWTRFSLEAQQEMEERRKNTATATGGYAGGAMPGGYDSEAGEKAGGGDEE